MSSASTKKKSDNKKSHAGADQVSSALKKPAVNAAALQNLKDMFQLGRDMTNAKTADEKMQLVLLKFAEAYLNEHTHSTKSSQRSMYLEGMMDVIIDDYAFFVAGGTDRDAMIFDLAGKNPKVRDAMVKYLYARAISEGVLEKDKNVWIYAVKGVLCMGNDAIRFWNKIVAVNTPKFQANLTLPENIEDKYGKAVPASESEIGKYFTTLKDTPRELAALYHPALLVKWLANAALERPAGLTVVDNKVIDDLLKNLQTAEHDFPERIHQIFMNEYLQAYIAGSTQVGKENQPGKLQLFLESVITDETENRDAVIFATVSTKTAEALSIATRAVTSALKSLTDKRLAPSRGGDKAKSQFINILKAVQYMGIIDEWNQLAQSNFAHLMLSNTTDLSEKGIEKFWNRGDWSKAEAKADKKTKATASNFGFISNNKNSKRGRSSDSESAASPPPAKRR